MIEILSTTALATVQDQGRTGALQWGVGTSGAMDPLALAAGNLLLGNDETAAGIEMQVFPFSVCFEDACAFAVTGADCAARLDGDAILPWWSYQAAAGQSLHLDLPTDAAWRGARAYLCVAGGIDVPVVLGSRSTQMRGAFGGHQGRALRKGDKLKTGANFASKCQTGYGLVAPALKMARQIDGHIALRVLPAAEYDLFTAESREVFWSEPYRITPQADRYGYRLAGPNVVPSAPLELRSHGIVPGVIQVPHGGQPIIQMRDAQPSGGYPKIGTVIGADLWRLGQAPIGSRMRFVQCTWDEAVAALEEVEDWLGHFRRSIDHRRNIQT